MHLTRWLTPNRQIREVTVKDSQGKDYLIYRKSSIYPPGGLIYFKHIWGGGGVGEEAYTMVSVLHKELEYKVKKLKYKKLEVMQPRVKNKYVRPSSWWINLPGSVHTQFYSRDWLIQSIIY